MLANLTRRRSADALVETMLRHGVDRLFCVPGESYLALLDALYDQPAIDLIVARHESGAGFMAMADSRCTGRPAVCLVSRGPGATNAAIAVHSAEQDGSPLLLLVGQVPRRDVGRGAFQEVNYRSMFGTIARDVIEVSEGSELPRAFSQAWAAAITGTPGPAVVVVPEDVFEDRADVEAAGPQPLPSLPDPSPGAIDRLLQLLSTADRPLFIAGGALDAPEGRDALARAAARHGVPVLLSYKRSDLFDNADALYGGYLGFKVPGAHVKLLAESDLIIAVGTRLGDVTTQNYTFPAAPDPEQTLVHVHPDKAHLGRIYRTDLSIAADATRVLELLADGRRAVCDEDRRGTWAHRLHLAAAGLARYSPTPREDGIEFGAVVRAISLRAARDAVVVMDGGNFGGWVHRLWPWTPANRLVGTAGGAMGMGVPGGVAASLRLRPRQVISFVGDGGFMMTGAEIVTAVEHGASALFVVANNSSYGAIRLQQEISYPGRACGSTLAPVHFARLAEACGARGFSVSSLDEIEQVLDRAFAARGPVVIDVRTSLEAISAYTTLSEARSMGQRNAKP